MTDSASLSLLHDIFTLALKLNLAVLSSRYLYSSSVTTFLKSDGRLAVKKQLTSKILDIFRQA